MTFNTAGWLGVGLGRGGVSQGQGWRQEAKTVAWPWPKSASGFGAALVGPCPLGLTLAFPGGQPPPTAEPGTHPS